MRRLVSLIFALSLVFSGAVLLVLGVLYLEGRDISYRMHGGLFGSGAFLLALGAYWLWTDFLRQTRE
jgi:hypothetical protein